MIHFQKHKLANVLKWVCFNLMENSFRPSKTTLCPSGSCHISPNPRFYGKKRVITSENVDTIDNVSTTASLSRRKEAQAALLEYLLSTRGLQFMDAENMSTNSPRFLERFLTKFEADKDIGWSITRFLRYHPINEFEPFFESLGLNPSECTSFLPHNLLFLSDDKLLLENYHVLCNYGIPRNRIGKIYKEATEVFRYDSGTLQSRLESIEEMGLDKSSVIKIVAASPNLLMGNAHRELFKVLEELKTFGIECGWIGEHSGRDSYNWSRMLELLCCLSKLGCSKVQLGGIICQHPGLLLECSGTTTLSLIGFLLKFGATTSQITSMFLQFQQSHIWKHVWNLKHCYHFLVEAEMDVQEIGRIVCFHPVLLGSCSLKKVSSLLVALCSGKKQVREIIIKDPKELKNWVLGSRVERLKSQKEESLIKKARFFLDLGFVEHSPQMRKAMKDFRGEAGELQERFNCLVDSGLDRRDVIKMVKAAPQILNQSKDMLEMKIDFLVNGLGYPVSVLVTFPGYMSYTIERANLRVSMYNWLIDQGTVDYNLALSTLITVSDKLFMKKFVNLHPRGPEIWEKLKKGIYPD